MCESYVSVFQTKDGSNLTLIFKGSDLSRSVLICASRGWVINLDPSAMSRGSIRVRSYRDESFYARPNAEPEYHQAVMDALRAPDTDPIFQNPTILPVYSQGFSNDALSRLPVQEMMQFTSAAIKDARVFFNRPKENYRKEQETQATIRDLKAKLQKRGQKRRARQKEAKYNY